ncbi:MAG: DUF5916 domain-containing protein [Bacteroidota bacterium]|nr:DUF5916 domain-containing protein [Bacteroidota bacterium]
MPYLALLTMLLFPDDERRLTAVLLPPETHIQLDGRLDESFWMTVPGSDAFRQQEPDEGAAPTEKTVVRVAYTRHHLFIGVICYDADPDGIRSYQRQRDMSLATDDRFMWILDTYRDGRSAYFFEINPGGLMGDGLLTSDQSINLNKDWDGIWTARTARGAYGWSAEIRIPFRTVNFDASGADWGINFQRTIRRRTEELVWSGHRRHQGLFRVRNAGLLTGLKDLSQGFGLEISPYGLAAARYQRASYGRNTSANGDAGMDLTYSITTNLRASVSINTDFAETEVDQRRVNLTRFPLRYPEQRDFFLEGSHIFQFAPSSGVYPYFSRRIGLESGQTIPLQAGARLAGQVGRFDVGLIQIRSGSAGDFPGEDFTIARTKAHILSASTVGVIYTRRSTQQSNRPLLQDRHTLGVDLELSSTTAFGDRNLNFQAFFIAHNAALADASSTLFDRSTRGVRVSYPNQPFSMHASYREFGSGYDPAVGFAPRNGFRRFQPSFEYSWLLSQHARLREVIMHLRHEFLMDLDFRPETVNTSLLPEIRFIRGAEIAVTIGHDYEWLRSPFDIRRDGSALIPAGGYHTFESELEVQSARQRKWSVGGGIGYGGFWTGTRTQMGADMVFRPLSGINLSASWSRNGVNLEEASFATNLVRTSASIALTPLLAFTANLQYDDLSRIAGLYSRLRWTVRPGSDLYVVYTHNWQQNPLDRFRSLNRQTAAKLAYTARL